MIHAQILQSYPKGKLEDGQAEIFHRTIGKRRASHQSSEHDLEEQITEWANMTWFLLALGGVCLQKPRTQQHVIVKSVMSMGSVMQSSSLSSLSLSTSSFSSGRGSMHPSTSSLVAAIGTTAQEVQYCPVTQ